MAKVKRFYYLVDDLTPEKSEVMARGLKALSIVEGVKIDVAQNLVEIVATRNPDSNVQMACDVAGTVLRTKMKKKQAF